MSALSLASTGSILASEAHAPSFNPTLAMILVPMIGAVVVALLPARRADSVRLVATLFSAISGALGIWMLVEFQKGNAGFQFELHHSWLSDLGISFHLGVDGISLFLLVLTGVLFPLAIIGIKPDHDAKPYYAWLLLLMGGCMGVFMALDLIVFFLFFEIVLVPMYFLIGIWGHGDKVYAATKFFLYTMFGSAFMLVAIVATAFLHQRASGGALTFDLTTIANDQSIATNSARWLFAGFAIAFAVKVPLFPLHTWLPDAHTEAPTAGSVILAGVMLKLGTYGFLRFGLYLFPEASHFFAPVLLTMGTVGIVYGAICATVQKDLKRLVAYSSVAHLGFIIVGTFSLTTQGVEGGVVQMVNHGITTPALFILVGMIYDRRHTRQIAELNGLQKVAPIFAGVFTVVMLSSIGLPGLNGFVGEFLSLLGGFKGARWWTVVAATGVILAALYLLWAYQRVFHGEPSEENRSFPELRFSEGMLLAPLLALIIFLGVWPTPMIERIEPAVTALLSHVQQHAPGADTTDVVVRPVAPNEASGAGEPAVPGEGS